jgi:hypothetical protein
MVHKRSNYSVSWSIDAAASNIILAALLVFVAFGRLELAPYV